MFQWAHTISNDRAPKELYSMPAIKNLAIRLLRDEKGQDLIEYALMAGFVAVAAGAIMPGVSTNISIIFSKVDSAMTGAANAS
jgi:pilus assembly protein Flp/PilA